jgi:hypothetical protein
MLENSLAIFQNVKNILSNRSRYACMGEGVYGEFLYFPLNFTMNLKTTLKNKVF